VSLVVEVGWVVDLSAEAVIDKLRMDLQSDRPLIISGAWSLNVASHLMEQVADSVDTLTLLPYTDEAPRGLRHLSLGLNASFNPFKPIGDRTSYAIFLSEVFRGAFKLSNTQASALKRALVRAYSNNKEPSVEDVISALEVESAELTNREAVDLMEALEAMERGRLGAACRGGALEPRSAISMSELPPSYATAISMTILMHALKGGSKEVVTVCDVDLLEDFLGSARGLAIDLLNRLSAAGLTVIMCAGSASALPLELRSRSRASMIGAPLTAEDARDLSAVLGRRAIRLLNSKERFAYKLVGSAGVVEVPLKEAVRVAVAAEVEPQPEAPRPTLYTKLGNRAKMAYEVLSFLRDGPSARDSVISYAMHRLDISSLEASRLINALLTHGLASEVVGADGKYWLKITVRGLNTIEELEALEGWLTRG
jgi:hypothetical protein